MAMRLIAYKAEYQEPMLALHRSAIEGFTLGMSQQEDESDLVAIEQVYLRNGGEFVLGFIDENLTRWVVSKGSQPISVSCGVCGLRVTSRAEVTAPNCCKNWSGGHFNPAFGHFAWRQRPDGN